MRTRIIAPVVLLAATTGLAACGGGGSSSSSGGYGAKPAPKQAAAGETITTTSKGRLGTFLVDEDGHAVYLFEKDKGARSTCYGACATAWPPVTTTAAPRVAGAVSQQRLGTVRRTDGMRQVTYAGHPLYYYAGDASPGSTTGEGLDQFGAEWYLLTPAGRADEAES